MLDQSTRTTILTLHHKGLSTRRIARFLKISRPVVSRVVAVSALACSPPSQEKTPAYRDPIPEPYLLMIFTRK